MKINQLSHFGLFFFTDEPPCPRAQLSGMEHVFISKQPYTELKRQYGKNNNDTQSQASLRGRLIYDYLIARKKKNCAKGSSKREIERYDISIAQAGQVFMRFASLSLVIRGSV